MSSELLIRSSLAAVRRLHGTSLGSTVAIPERTEHVKAVGHEEVREHLVWELGLHRRFDWNLRGARLWGLPRGVRWVEIVGASVLAGVAPKTITGWLAKGGPARQPFPEAHRVLDRLYWPMAVVLAWCDGREPEVPARLAYPVGRVDMRMQLAWERDSEPAPFRWTMGWLWGLDMLKPSHSEWLARGWVDIVGASVITGFAPKTITGWLARGGPSRCPFPPAYRFLYRLYWPLEVVTAWTEYQSTVNGS
jgi:hypothetical protein